MAFGCFNRCFDSLLAIKASEGEAGVLGFTSVGSLCLLLCRVESEFVLLCPWDFLGSGGGVEGTSG